MQRTDHTTNTPQSAAYLQWLGVETFVPNVQPPYALLSEQPEQSAPVSVPETVNQETAQEESSADTDSAQAAATIRVLLPEPSRPECPLAAAVVASITRMFALASVTHPVAQGGGEIQVGDTCFGFEALLNEPAQKRRLFARLCQIRSRARWG